METSDVKVVAKSQPGDILNLLVLSQMHVSPMCQEEGMLSHAEKNALTLLFNIENTNANLELLKRITIQLI